MGIGRDSRSTESSRTSLAYHSAMRRVPSIEVFAIGSPVNVSTPNQVAWRDGVSRRCEWLEAFEVEAVEMAERMAIGFREE